MSRADVVRLERTKGRRLHGALFSLTAAPLPSGQRTSRWTCVVSKKVASKAVERNRIKRRCREAARAHVRDVPAPLALLFRAKKEAAGATFADVGRDVHALVEKLLHIGYNSSQ